MVVDFSQAENITRVPVKYIGIAINLLGISQFVYVHR